MSYHSPTDLFSALGGAPDLPGAACLNKWGLFDPEPEGRTEPPEVTRHRHAQAGELCRGCTALASCEQWVDSLPPSKRPSGVVAGRAPKTVGRPANTYQEGEIA